MGDVVDMTERDRSNDIVVVHIKSGKLLVDNRSKYYGLYQLNKTMPGTVEYLNRNVVEDTE